jgi:hypothetical protein
LPTRHRRRVRDTAVQEDREGSASSQSEASGIVVEAPPVRRRRTKAEVVGSSPSAGVAREGCAT